MNTPQNLSRILLAAALLAPAAFAVDAPAVYKEHCAKCHGDSGLADSWRGYLFFAQDFSKASFQNASSDEEILKEINEGPRIMPAFEKTLSLEERQALVRLIREFGKAP